MAILTIQSFSFTPTLTSAQVVHVKWRRSTDPDSSGSYTMASDASAAPDGTLASPLAITVPDEDVVVVATSACGSSGFAKEFYIANCCDEGDTLNGATCTHIDTSAATSTGIPTLLCHYTNAAYSQYGALIYSTYNTDGTYVDVPDSTLVNSNAGGTSTSTLWGNPSSNTTDGRLNKTALWDCSSQTTIGNLGFGFQFNVPVDSTYYIAFGADNTAKLTVDNVVVINQDANAIGALLCGGTGHIECAFKYWHIYPVTLTQGSHSINVIGNNVGSVGAFGCEIYNTDAATLKGCTTASGSYGDTTLATTNLHRYIVFTTESVANNTESDIGTWTCASGYTLVKIGSAHVCQLITNSEASRCPSSRIGVIVSPQTDAITIAPLYPKIKVLRTGFTLGTGSTTYQSYSNAGYDVVVTLNSASPTPGADAPFPTGGGLTTYSTNLDTFFTAAAPYNVSLVCIQNEENNTSYWNGTASDYLAMLDIAIPKAHTAGIEVSNGGLTGKGLAWMVWKDINDNISTSRGDTFAAKVFDSGDAYTTWSSSSGPYQEAIAFMQTAIPAYATKDLDYVNFHWKEPSRTADINATSINDAMLEIIDYLVRITGKRVITHELGQTSGSTATDILPQCLDLLMGKHLDYIIIYDGDGGDYAMHDPTTLLIRDTGTSVNNFLLTHQ